MANEIQTSSNLTFSKNSSPSVNWSASASVTVTGNYYVSGVISVGTGDETIALGDIGTVGWVCLKNLDATNFITAGADGSSYPIKLKAGEDCKLRWNGAAVHVKADTGACKAAYVIVED